MKKLTAVSLLSFIIFSWSFLLTTKSALSANDDEYQPEDMVNIGEYSDNINTAISGIGSSDKILIIDKDIALDADTNVPENILLNVINNGSITLGDYDLIIHTFEAGPYPCIVCNGSGKVTLGTNTIGIYPQWFGEGTLDDETLQSAITAIGINKQTFNITPGTWTIDQDLTFKANIKLKFEEGALFDIEGAKVTINGSLDSGAQQIFNVDPNGNVVFGDGVALVYRIDWFGTNTAVLTQIISAVPTGGVIKLNPGTTYTANGQYIINKPLTIDAYGAVLFWPEDNDANRGMVVTASDVHIFGLELKGPQHASSVATQLGIYSHGADAANYISNLKVIDCTIHNWGYIGIILKFVEDFEILSNKIDDIFFMGILCKSSRRGYIKANNITNISGNVGGTAYGIALSREGHNSIATHPRCYNIKVENNTIRRVTSWEGLDTHGGVNITFKGNIVSDCKIGINVGASADVHSIEQWAPINCIVEENIINSGVTDGTMCFGIAFYGAIDKTIIKEKATGIIRNNTIRGYGKETKVNVGGIYTRVTENLVIKGNMIIEPSPYGIYLYHQNFNFDCTGNTIIDAWSNTHVVSGIYSNGPSNTGHIAGNIFKKESKTDVAHIFDRAITVSNHSNCVIRLGENFSNANTYLVDAGANTLSYKDLLYYGDTLDDTTLHAAITAIGADHWALNPPKGTWDIDADLTFNDNTHLKFEKGAVFDINDATVAINGDIDAGSYQIFDCTNNGIVSFTNSAVKNLCPAWWGNDADVSMTVLSLEDTIDICNTDYQWNKSSAGIDEYYLQLRDGGNPKIKQPYRVNENGLPMKTGKVDNLDSGKWGWGDPDTKLGYNTLVVRLNDAYTADPENKPNCFLSFESGNKFSFYSSRLGGFYLKDCQIENYNEDYKNNYTNSYNTTTFEMYTKDSVSSRKFDIIPFRRFSYNPGITIIEGNTYIKFFYLH